MSVFIVTALTMMRVISGLPEIVKIGEKIHIASLCLCRKKFVFHQNTIESKIIAQVPLKQKTSVKKSLLILKAVSLMRVRDLRVNRRLRSGVLEIYIFLAFIL